MISKPMFLIKECCLFFYSVNLALNSLNRDAVFDGKMATHRSIPDATVRLDGHFVFEAIRIHTCVYCIFVFQGLYVCMRQHLLLSQPEL